MNRQFVLFRIDRRISKAVFGLPAAAAVILFVMTTCLMTVLSPEMKAWRFGYLGQEFLILLFLLWPFQTLQRWFGKEEAESLRGAGKTHSCLWSLLLALAFELAVLLAGTLFGLAFQVNYLGEITRIMIYQSFMTAALYLLTVLLRSAFLPFVLAASYCLICAMFGGSSSLGWLCLIRPGVSAAADFPAILPLLPILPAALILFAIAHDKEKKLVWL